MLPHAPGVYLMRDSAGTILYVGKARDLAKRVASYFVNKSDHAPKINILVTAIHHIDYIPTASEREALIVEQRLIRQIQPHYNTMWRDDKSYPYIKLTVQEDFPRLYITRKKIRDGALYFGPYPQVHSMRKLLVYLWKHKFFPLRPCKYEFSVAQPLPLEKAKQCLYYHTRECPAPCVGRVSKEQYNHITANVKHFFEGHYKPLMIQWEQEMKEASKKQNYERAAQLRDNLGALQHMDERVTLRQIDIADVAGFVDMSRAVTDLQKALDLHYPPQRMECFDISHIQGTEPVASMVIFDRGKPMKSGYRTFKIKTVVGIDDFASMAEVVGRRYRRLLAEKAPLPDLILIDGGKGQLSSAAKALKEVFKEAQPRRRIPEIASLAKQHEELFVPERSNSICLPKDSAALHLVQHIRDEAHRFAITFHRKRRAKASFQ